MRTFPRASALAVAAALTAAAGCTPASLRMNRTLDVNHEASAAHFRVEYAPLDHDVAPAVRDAVEHALLRVGRWGALAAPLTVRLFPDHASLIEAVGGQDYPWLRAWARYDEVLVQSPRTWGIDYTRQLPELLTHELTHVVMYQRIAQAEDWEDRDIPLWFREGMASYTAQQGYRRGRPDEIGVALGKRPLVDPFEPTTATLRDHKDLVYNSGHWSFTYLVRTRGEEVVGQLLDEVRRGRPFEKSFEHVYGRSSRDFLGRWRTMIMGSAGDTTPRPERSPGPPKALPPSPPGPPPAAAPAIPGSGAGASSTDGAAPPPPPPPPTEGGAEGTAGGGARPAGEQAFVSPGCVPPPGPVPASVNSPSRGQLQDGQAIPNVPGIALMKRHVFATVETAALLIDAVDQVREDFPGTTPLPIGHASRKGGGRLRPHASHQSGRDVDAGYYVKQPEDPPRWQVTNKRNLDAARTWKLFEALIASGRVEYIFADHRIQRELHRHAKGAGVPDADLLRILQYPRGRRHRVGLIRHESGHRDHFHIRFHCPMGDRACKPR